MPVATSPAQRTNGTIPTTSRPPATTACRPPSAPRFACGLRYALRRPWLTPTGTTELVFELLQLMRQLASLIPRPYTNLVRCNLVRYFGTPLFRIRGSRPLLRAFAQRLRQEAPGSAATPAPWNGPYAWSLDFTSRVRLSTNCTHSGWAYGLSGQEYYVAFDSCGAHNEEVTPTCDFIIAVYVNDPQGWDNRFGGMEPSG